MSSSSCICSSLGSRICCGKNLEEKIVTVSFDVSVQESLSLGTKDGIEGSSLFVLMLLLQVGISEFDPFVEVSLLIFIDEDEFASSETGFFLVRNNVALVLEFSLSWFNL